MASHVIEHSPALIVLYSSPLYYTNQLWRLMVAGLGRGAASSLFRE
jgi:hypothetical protein